MEKRRSWRGCEDLVHGEKTAGSGVTRTGTAATAGAFVTSDEALDIGELFADAVELDGELHEVTGLEIAGLLPLVVVAFGPRSSGHLSRR